MRDVKRVYMGQIPRRANVTGITNALPCVLTIDENPGIVSFDFVRLTDLNGAMPVPRGEDPLNNHRYRVVLTSDTTFKLQDPITYEYIDSTNYPPYVEGGFCNLIERSYIYHSDEE
jgi:hypothetical protein